MASTSPAVAVIPIDLGPISAYDQDIYPPEYYTAPDNFSKGNVLIKATLEEMKSIKERGIDLNENEDFIIDTRVKVGDLKLKMSELQDNRKTLNPFKAFLNYRAKRLFHATSKTVYIQTKRTSERIHREYERIHGVQVIPTAQMQMLDGAPPPGARVEGIAVYLPNGLTDEAERTINDARETIATTNPFENNSLTSQLRDGEQEISLAGTESVLGRDVDGFDADEGNQTSATSSDLQRSHPTTPQSIHYNFFQNSVINTNSSLSGFTFNHGERNSGASVTQEFAP